MNLEKILQNLDAKESILVEWAMDQIENKRNIDEQTAMMIEEQVFTDLSIPYMTDHFDIYILTRIFREISAQRFSNHADMLIQKWPEWEDNIAGQSAQVIAQTDPAGAADLFRNYCQQGEFKDFNKWQGVSQSLAHLPDNEAKQIAGMMTHAYIGGLPNKSAARKYTVDILRLTWNYELPEFDELFQQVMIDPRGVRVFEEDIVLILKIFGFPDTECLLILDLIEGASGPVPSDLKLFYKDDIPLEALDDAVKKLKKRSFGFMPSFFDEYKAVIKNERIRMVFNDLFSDKITVARSEKKKRKLHICVMVLSGLMSSLQKQEADLSAIPMDEAVKLVSADIKTIPFFDSFAAFFKKQDKAENIRYLTKALKENYELYGSGHILKLMGELGYDEFLKPLTDALSDGADHAYIYETAEQVLSKYKDRAIDFFTEYFPRMNNLAKNSALEIVQRIGGPRSIEYVDKHFDAYMKIEKEFILRACRILCSEKCLERLKPKVGKGQHLIDEACVVITLLMQGKTAETEKLLDQCYEKRKEQTDLIQSVMTGKIPDMSKLSKPYVEAELRCKNCGDESTYELKRVIVGSSGGKVFIAQEIECISCETISEFELTSKGEMMITGQLMRLMLIKSDEEKKKAFKESPVEYGNIIAFGKEMEIQDAIDKYQDAIKENPGDASNYIGLGNVYIHLSMNIKAAEYFNKAAEADPSYIQSYFSLANIAAEYGDTDSALKLLEQGKSFFGSWKYKQGSSDIDRDGFAKIYCDLYNSILMKTKSSKPRLNLSSFDIKPLEPVLAEPVKAAKKIGRNAPCPCGSGKKYKKCCLG